jgi:ABC-type sugar transport system permease subunit
VSAAPGGRGTGPDRRVGASRAHAWPPLAPYLFLAPNVLVFGVFIIIPALYDFYLSLFRVTLQAPAAYVGVGNFAQLIQRDDIFWTASRNTGVFVVGDMALTMVFALAIALLLNAPIRARGFFRGIFFYPVILSPVIVAEIWRWVLNTQYGLANAFLRTLGLPIQPWLLRADYAMEWVIVSNVWATVGFFALILLAGLQAIQPALYEAADVDGASRWNSFLHVTLPLLLPSLLVVFILGTIRAFQVFEYIFVLTGGGPGFATLTIVQYIYRAAFQQNEFGLAAAASLLLVMVLGLLTGLQYVMGRLGEAV